MKKDNKIIKNKKTEILLAIDVGNTNIGVGLFKDDALVKKIDLITSRQTTAQTFLKNLKNNIDTSTINVVMVSSVVPTTTKIIKQALRGLFKKRLLILGEDILCPIKNLYKKPAEVGQDRLVNSYAALKLYGTPIIVVDSGTAITFDVVSRRGQYLGGVICPGLGISAKALYNFTALLPKITIQEPKELIGRDTIESMRSGLFFGYGSLCNGLILKLKEKIGLGTLVIGTGGRIDALRKYCTQINRVNPELTLKGLLLIYKNIKNKQFY